MAANRNSPLPLVVGDLRWPDVHPAIDLPPAFVDLLPVAIFATDPTGAVTWANRRADALWGRDVGGARDDRRVSPARTLGLDSFLSRALTTGEELNGVETIIERCDGSRSFAVAAIQPVKAENGRVAGAIVCLEDISALHDAEARLTALERDRAQAK